MTINDFQNKINKKFPNENLQVLDYTQMKKSATIQCLTCGEIITMNNAYNFFTRHKECACPKCFPPNRKSIIQKQNQFINFLKEQNKFEFNEQDIRNQLKNTSSLIGLKCTKCGKINYKTVGDYLRGRGCSCSCMNTLKTTEQFKLELPEEIELLEPYQGAFTSILFKHKTCGFIWKAKPHNILSGKGCPKCNRKISKGEQKIIFYLKEHNIQYIHEYPVEIEGHHLRIDFYFPQYNFGIEYNGIQHYQVVKHFGGENKLKKQQYYDSLKNKNFNIITISYKDFENINSILSLVFNDYLEKEQD